MCPVSDRRIVSDDANASPLGEPIDDPVDDRLERAVVGSRLANAEYVHVRAMVGSDFVAVAGQAPRSATVTRSFATGRRTSHMPLRIGFTGDVMLGRLVDDRQRDRPVDAVWGTVLERLRDLDGLVINLECVLSTRGRQWQRTHRPFHFRADPDWAIPALERAGVDICALANNHVLDYEEVALRDTIDALDDAGIAHTGAGATIGEALAPAVRTISEADAAGDPSVPASDAAPATGDDGLDIALVSLTDNTPEYAAADDSPGTARIEIDTDDSATRRRVREALERARGTNPDLLVASLHWGPNMVTEPPASFRDFGRWLVENGVDVIHGHSATSFRGSKITTGVRSSTTRATSSTTTGSTRRCTTIGASCSSSR